MHLHSSRGKSATPRGGDPPPAARSAAQGWIVARPSPEPVCTAWPRIGRIIRRQRCRRALHPHPQGAAALVAPLPHRGRAAGGAARLQGSLQHRVAGREASPPLAGAGSRLPDWRGGGMTHAAFLINKARTTNITQAQVSGESAAVHRWSHHCLTFDFHLASASGAAGTAGHGAAHETNQPPIGTNSKDRVGLPSALIARSNRGLMSLRRNRRSGQNPMALLRSYGGPRL